MSAAGAAPDKKPIKPKPFGPIPAGFPMVDGKVHIAGKPVADHIDEIGQTPAFLYDAALLDRKVAELRAAMPQRLAIHYAMKANPYGPLLRHMTGLCDGIDLASGGELQIALAAGASPENMSFAGPAKTDAELKAAISAGVTINLESEGEAKRAIIIGDTLGITPRLAVRVNPDFDLRGSGMRMGGGAKAFGVDQERVPDLVRQIIDAGAHWRGFHIYAGSQSLDSAALAETQANTIALAARLAEDIGHAPEHINLGGGFGIPYFSGDQPVNLSVISAELQRQFTNLPEILADCDFAIELGRYLVGEAGIYVTRIIDRKISHGEVFLACDGGLHHQLAASGNFGTVVRRNYPVSLAQAGNGPEEIVNIVGCLCTPLDRLGDRVSLKRAETGDLVIIYCAGAYGASASPVNFLGHGAAKEILLYETNLQ